MTVAQPKSVLGELAKITPQPEKSLENLTNSVASADELKAKFFGEVKALGRKAAGSALTLFEVAMKFQSAVRDNVVKAGNAGDVYDQYAEGYRLVVAGEAGVKAGAEAMSANSKKVQVSILGTFAQPGPVALGEDLYRRVVTLRGEIASEDRTGSAYANFAAVNRAVAKKLDELGGDMQALVAFVNSPETGDAFIVAAISKQAATPKTALEKMNAILKAMQALGKSELTGNDDYAKMVTYAEWFASELGKKVKPSLA